MSLGQTTIQSKLGNCSLLALPHGFAWKLGPDSTTLRIITLQYTMTMVCSRFHPHFEPTFLLDPGLYVGRCGFNGCTSRPARRPTHRHGWIWPPRFFHHFGGVNREGGCCNIAIQKIISNPNTSLSNVGGFKYHHKIYGQ